MIRIVVRYLFLFFIGTLLAVSLPNAIAFAQDTSKDTTRTSFVSWHPDGMMLALAFRDEVRILDAETLETLNSFLVSRVQYTAPVWSPDGTLLAFGNYTDLEIWSEPWSSNSANRVAVLAHNEHSAFGTISTVAWSPDGDRLASANGGYIKVWDTDTWQSLAFLGGDWEIQRQIAWSPSGDRFASADKEGAVVVWETQTYERILGVVFATSVYPNGHLGNPAANTIAWFPSGNQLVVGSSEGAIRIVDTTPTTPVIQIENANSTKIILAHVDSVTSVAWRSGSNEVASASDDGTIKIWNIKTQELKQTIEVELPGDIWSIAWSPDGTKLAYGTPDRSVKIIEIPVFDDSSDVPKAGG